MKSLSTNALQSPYTECVRSNNLWFTQVDIFIYIKTDHCLWYYLGTLEVQHMKATLETMYCIQRKELNEPTQTPKTEDPD